MDDRELERFRAALEADVEALTAEDTRSWTDELAGVAMASDGYIPFRDNIDHAARHGVRYIAEPGGSARNVDVEAACEEHGIRHVATGVRLFRH
jgi:phosphoribosylaminoimidazolecarboxamide formyltransferase/IMP cyclohydrolase